MRICILTPGSLGSNPRVVKEAEALIEAGHDVHVVSTTSLPHLEFCDVDVLSKAAWRSTQIDLGERTRYRIERIVQIISKFAFRVSKIRKFADIAISPSARLLKKHAMNIEADLYIAHYVAALPAASHAATRRGALFAFDAEDFHLGDLPDLPSHTLEKRIIRAVEGTYLPGSAYVTAASPLIAEAYAATYAIRIPIVILNVFPKANAPTGPTAAGATKPGPSIYWFSQTIGPGRGLETAVEAISLAASAPHLYLRGSFAGGFERYLQSLATRFGIERRLHFLEPAPPAQLERLGSEYDLGYSGETGFSDNRLRALTNKLFSYLLGGVPCIATDIPAHRQIAPDLGEALSLFPVNDAAALASAIDSFLLYPQRLAAARANAWNLGQKRFNWDVERNTLTETIEKLKPC